jgi:hypothetical protein
MPFVTPAVGALCVALIGGTSLLAFFHYRWRWQTCRLAWPATESPAKFVARCLWYLDKTGNETIAPEAGYVDLILKIEEEKVYLFCRAKGWSIGPGFVERALSISLNSHWPAIIVTCDPPSEREDLLVDAAGLDIIHYKLLPNLREVARRQMMRRKAQREAADSRTPLCADDLTRTSGQAS